MLTLTLRNGAGVDWGLSRFGGLVVAALIAVGQMLAGPAAAAPANAAPDGQGGPGHRQRQVPESGRVAEPVQRCPRGVGGAEAHRLFGRRRLRSGFHEMAERLKTFGKAADKASVALVFYAGHGLQMNGTNYFLPVDARVQREQDLAYDAISLDMILREAEAARDLRIIILDACRDNPFAARIARAGGATRALQIAEGLAQAGNVGRDTLVAYATAANALGGRRERQAQPLYDGASEAPGNAGAGDQPAVRPHPRQRLRGDGGTPDTVHLWLARRRTVLPDRAEGRRSGGAAPGPIRSGRRCSGGRWRTAPIPPICFCT